MSQQSDKSEKEAADWADSELKDVVKPPPSKSPGSGLGAPATPNLATASSALGKDSPETGKPPLEQPVSNPNVSESIPKEKSGLSPNATTFVPTVDPLSYTDPWSAAIGKAPMMPPPPPYAPTFPSSIFGETVTKATSPAVVPAMAGPQAPATQQAPTQVDALQQMLMLQAQQMQMMAQMLQGGGGPAPPGVGSSIGQSTTEVKSIIGDNATLSSELFNRLVGPSPQAIGDMQWNRWSHWEKGDREPIPKWNGNNPAQELKPWLKQLRIWRQETSDSVHKHGLKLYRSLPANTWLSQAAERIPEADLITAKSSSCVRS